MDCSGGFVVNGVRRTVIHQIVRAPGVWFGLDRERLSGRRLGRGRIIPARGPWTGFETSERDELRVRLNRWEQPERPRGSPPVRAGDRH